DPAGASRRVAGARKRGPDGDAPLSGAPLPIGQRPPVRPPAPRRARPRILRSRARAGDGRNGGDGGEEAKGRGRRRAPPRVVRRRRGGDRPGGRRRMTAVGWIRLGFVDVFGTANSVFVPADRWDDAIRNGVLFDGSAIEGRARVFESDLLLRPVPATLLDL